MVLEYLLFILLFIFMDFIIVPLLSILISMLKFYVFMIYVYIGINLLQVIGAVNIYNSFVYSVRGFLSVLIEPALYPFKKLIPFFKGFDFSPILLLFSIKFFIQVLTRLISKF